MNRNRNIVFAVVVAMAIIGSVYVGLQLSSIPSTVGEVTVIVQGLPAGESADISTVKPLVGGGFQYVNQSLASLQNDQSSTIRLQSFPANVTASVIGWNNYTLLMPANRVQEVLHAGQTVTFSYIRQYAVEAGVASDGGSIDSMVGGNVSQSGYYNASSVFTDSAVPNLGWMFIYWNVTSLVSSSYDNISTSNPLSLPLVQPLVITAVFVPNLYLQETNGTKGVVTIFNVWSPERVTLQSPTGDIIASTIASSSAAVPTMLNIQNVTQPFSGRFVVSFIGGPVIYSSPLVTGISSGDAFEF